MTNSTRPGRARRPSPALLMAEDNRWLGCDRMPDHARIVCAALMGSDGGVTGCLASDAQLADYLGTDKKAAARALAWLKARGLVATVMTDVGRAVVPLGPLARLIARNRSARAEGGVS